MKKSIVTISTIAVVLVSMWLIVNHFKSKGDVYYWRTVPVERGDVNVLVTATEEQQAKFTVDAYPNDVFTGVVTQVRHQPIMVQNVVNYVVIIEVPNPDLKLIPGLTANSNIFTEERKNVFKVPTNAFSFTPPVEYIQANKLLPDSVKNFWLKKLRQTKELKKQQIVESDKTIGYLWVKSGNDIFPVRVTKGLNDGTFTEINGDIKEGYEVASGINHSATTAETPASKSPFMPSFPTNKK